ncbi:MAG: type II toxin-antitoxin system VapC family toxin [Caulobacter sp.]|nr:type II toxin-antitoxin system VapC family toxin [Caulobacter sp.]
MTLVIDASVAVKWVLDEDGTEAAFALQAEPLTAPALWLLEAGNALWKRVSRGELSPEGADIRLAALGRTPVETTPIERDLPAALSLATVLRHPIYDCLYLAAAIREDAVVVTDDARFVRAVGGMEHAARVRRLGA